MKIKKSHTRDDKGLTYAQWEKEWEEFQKKQAEAMKRPPSNQGGS